MNSAPNHAAGGRAIPALPCHSLEDTLAFWTALGFEVTYRQKAPNHYGVVQRGGWEMHFFGLRELEPKANFSCCLVMVPRDVAGLHAEFVAALRTHLGRSPMAGLPRISRFRPGQTRFTVTDPTSNSVMFIEEGERDLERSEAYKKAGQTTLGKAVQLAARARDFHNDDVMAARVLDQALAREPGGDPRERAAALAARAELAAVLGQPERLQEVRAEFDALVLPAGEHARLASELSDPSVL